ncbi:ThuA domain-containing protein [Pseudactinotalea sp. Z1748]|uniref:ThuA domain-containing protein n=1 Tax=Pseudactinotalea sp. Z1748 TaxID=3413027 RepID=UPI003C7AEF75
MSTPTPPLRVTVWGENRHERTDASVAKIYPDGMHTVVAHAITEHVGEGAQVRTATLDEPEHGLSEEVLAATDVLTWWGHAAHEEVADDVVERVYQHVLSGMGLVALHSAHHAKVFRKLMGTTANLRWRSAEDQELIWTVDPTHPIAEGLPQPVRVPADEMYGEYFDVPTPDELVFISNFSGGEVFRSGCCWRRGHGRVFYFRSGDQEYPVYYQDEIRRIIANGVVWARPRVTRELPAVFQADRA